MSHILLVTDAVINLGLGVTLSLYPAILLRALGLPDIRPSFYARILGGVLFGIGLALLIEAGSIGNGLGLEGAVAINLYGAAMLAAALLTQRLQIPLRGRVILWGLCVLLIGLSLVELAGS